MGVAALQLPAITEATTELVVISSVPAKVEFNIDDLRTSVREALKEYDLVVTVDTVKGAKELMADLNKKAKSIKDVFKQAASIATAQVDEQSKLITELANEIVEARDKLKMQVERFESDRKAEAYEALKAEQVKLWDAENVSAEFRRSDAGQLVTLTCLTAKGSLTSGTASKLKDLIANDKTLQTQTEHRLLMLENESFKAGLKAVLTRDHVEAFLFADVDTYQQRLKAMLESEQRRQEATEAAARQQFEQEQAKQQEALQREKAKQQESQAQQAPAQQAATETTTAPTAAELRKQAADMRLSAAYCDDRAGNRSYLDGARELEEKAQQIEIAEAKKNEATAELYMLTSIHDVQDQLGTFKTPDFAEVIQAALSGSANKSTDSQPFYVAVWSKTAGKVAIVDGLSGQVFQRVSA